MIHQGKTVLFIKVKVCLIHCTKNEQETADLVTFTEEILNGRLHFLCSDSTLVVLEISSFSFIYCPVCWVFSKGCSLYCRDFLINDVKTPSGFICSLRSKLIYKYIRMTALATFRWLCKWLWLTHETPKFSSYKNQSIDLQSKSTD